jgi:hypothetical protein
MKKLTLSPKYQIIKEDILSILRGAIIMAVGTGLTYGLEAIAKLDFGTWTPVVSILTTMAINAIRKWLTTTKYV